MKIAISGASGLVGSAVSESLTAQGREVFRLVRTPAKDVREISWDPAAGRIATERLDGFDAVVHLAGEPIVGRWTSEKKNRIRDSRVKGTQLLSESLLQLTRPPRVLVCASAIGFYGSRGEELLTEESPSGTDFLAAVCREWEQASLAAQQKGVRVVNLRFGIILSTRGGALKQMLAPFRLGLGGRIGSGSQFMSWISIDDVVGVVTRAISDPQLSGPVNTVAPQSVTNLEFTKTLGHVLRRPTVFPVPAAGVKLVFGEMGEALLLSSTRVRPARLLASGYSFVSSNLEGALRKLFSTSQ